MIKQNNQILQISFFWIIAITSIYMVISELFIVTNKIPALIQDFSMIKILELTFYSIISLSFFGLAIRFHRSQSFRSQSISFIKKFKFFQKYYSYSAISILIGLIAITSILDLPFPLNKFLPLFQWLTFAVGIICLLSLQNSLKTIFQNFQKNQKLFGITSIIAVLIWGFFLAILNKNPASGPGQTTLTITWYQGLITIWIILTVEFLKSLGFLRKVNSILISSFLVLFFFILAGVVWSNIPFSGSYNMVGPFNEGMEWFPHSDSTRFDYAAQTALIGEGINYKNYIDNPLMVNYVTLLHLLQGGSFNAIIQLQIWLLAFIPSLVFLTGKKLFGLSAGIGSALFYFFRVKNILQNTDNTGLYSPRILLSEVILEPVLILLVLAFAYFISSKTRKPLLLIIIGGLFGLSTLVRANVWLILPFMLLMIFFLSWPHKWVGIRNCIIVFVSTTITLLPWMWRSNNTIDTPFFMLYKFRHSIYEERYQISNSKIPGIDQEHNLNRVKTAKVDLVNLNIENNFNKAQPENNIIELISQATENIVFNFGNSFLLLPFESQTIASSSGILYPRKYLVKFQESPPLAQIKIIISQLWALLFFTRGVVYITRKEKSAGFPILVYLAYILASAAALTAGSRYTQPVEWIFMTLFAGGGSLICNSLFSKQTEINEDYPSSLAPKSPSDKSRFTSDKLIPIGLYFGIFLIFCVSIFMILPDFIGKPRFPVFDKKNLINEYVSKVQNSTSRSEIESLLSSSNSVIQKGRIIYSLSLFGGKKFEHVFFEEKPYLLPDENDTLTLRIISSSGGEWVKLNYPQANWPRQSLVWKDVLYVGCKQEKFIQVSNMIVSDDEGNNHVYQSNPKIKCDDKNQ